jgi:hypothetical protein
LASQSFRVKNSLEVGTGVTITSGGNITAGVVTATSFVGSGSQLTQIVVSTVVGGAISATSLSVTGVSTFDGAVKIRNGYNLNIGDNNDLRIYNDGENSRIQETGSGTFYISGSDINIQQDSTNKNFARFVGGGAAELYYNDSKKFETSGIGITVTGTINSNQINTSGIITASYFVGNGSLLTNIGYATSAGIATSGDYAQSGATSAYATKRVLQYNETTKAVTYSNTLDAVRAYITGYGPEIHVSPVALDDTGNGTIGDPVKTIARAQVLATLAFETTGVGERKTIILHPGDYAENVTINTQFTVLTTHELVGKNTTLSGTLTITKGCTIDGLKMNNLVISATSATGSVDIIGCTVTTATTKTSSAYTVFRGCDLSSSTLSITGTGTVILVGGNYFTVTVNNAAAGVLSKAVVSMGPVTLTAGTLQLSDTLVYSATNTSNAITQSAGSVLTLNNSQTLIPTLTNVARNSFGGFYSILHSVYDKPNSTFGGTSLNSISYSQYINADRIGIGTTNPTSALTVVGDVLVSGVVTATTYYGDISNTVSGRWVLGASGSSDYTFTGIGFTQTTNDPTLYLKRGEVYEFVNNSGGSHPFQIRVSNGGAAYNNGVTNNGASSGTIIFQVPYNAPNSLYYQCTNHSSMGGDIVILGGGGIWARNSSSFEYSEPNKFKGVIETVSTATTYNSAAGSLVLELDVRQATTYTYTIPTDANIGIVSFKNMSAPTGSANGMTITCIFTQNAAGTGNTTGTTGIGTNCTVIGYENGAAVAGISTRALVGSGTTVSLSATANDRDFVSFFIHYTGDTNTTASSYQVYVTKNGGFRQGNVGV